MRKFMKLKLFFMVTVVFSVVFSFATFADTQILPTMQTENNILPLNNVNVNYITLEEKIELVYNNEIIFLSPIFSQNFQNIFSKMRRQKRPLTNKSRFYAHIFQKYF